jgi:plastocyanin
LTAFASIGIPLNYAGAQEETTSPFKTVNVTIPNGAANPTLDLSLQKLANWYDPKTLTISAGDTVVWKNEDIEAHTVTSGRGAGIASVQTNEKGAPDGIFDSEFFGPGESWSYTFYTPGTYSYFCTIHPWMEGAVTVNRIAAEDIPSYPVDGSGNRHSAWPVHTFSNDGKYDIDMKWDPVSIQTGKPVTLFIDFFDARTNERLQLTPYEFVIMQDGKELDRNYALTDIGMGVYKYEFSRPGPITMRVEAVDDNPESWSEFSTIVYPNPESTDYGQGAEVTRVSGGTQPVSRVINPLTLVIFTYGVIFGIPAAVGAVIVLYKKGKI